MLKIFLCLLLFFIRIVPYINSEINILSPPLLSEKIKNLYKISNNIYNKK